MEQQAETTSRIDVLLVEDDESHARLIQRAFNSSGVSVALRHAKDLKGMRSEVNRKCPDLLILDYLLPDGRGMDTIAGEAWPGELPTIVITSFLDAHVVSEAQKIGAREIVEKSPAGFTALPQLVSAQFRQGDTSVFD